MLKILFIFGLVLGGGCVSRSMRDIGRAPSSKVEGLVNKEGFRYDVKLAAPTSYGIRDLRADLDRAGGRIADLIPLLPEVFRRNYVMVFEKRSLQDSSPEFPRIIMFNEDASFVMTFNGSSTQAGYEGVETLRFDYQTRDFTFEEVVAKADAEERARFLIDKKLAAAQYFWTDLNDRTGPNAQTCLGCHRSDPRPNWQQYPLWQGVYGQVDGYLLLNTSERTNFENFLRQNQPNLPNPTNPTSLRYVNLIPLAKLPLEDHLRLVSASDLTERLERLVFLKLSRRIMQAKEVARYIFAIIGTQANCDLTKLAPDLSNADLARVIAETKAAQIRAANEAIADIAANLKLSYSQIQKKERFFDLLTDAGSAKVGALRYVLSKMGIELDDFSMDFMPDHDTFSTPGAGISNFYGILESDWFAVHREQLPIFYHFDRPFCASLRSLVH